MSVARNSFHYFIVTFFFFSLFRFCSVLKFEYYNEKKFDYYIEYYTEYYNENFEILVLKSPLNFVSAIFYQIFIFSPNDSPSKTMKSVLYFI